MAQAQMYPGLPFSTHCLTPQGLKDEQMTLPLHSAIAISSAYLSVWQIFGHGFGSSQEHPLPNVPLLRHLRSLQSPATGQTRGTLHSLAAFGIEA